MADLMVNNAMPILIGLGVAFVLCLALIVIGWSMWRRETDRKLAALSPTTSEAPPMADALALSVATLPTPDVAAPMTAAQPAEDIPAAPSLPEASHTVVETPDAAPASSAYSLDALQLLRDPATGQLRVGIGSDVYASARDVRRPEHQRLLLGSTRDLLIFLGQTRAAAALPAGPAPTVSGEPGPVPAQPISVVRPAPAPAATGAMRLPSMNPFQQYKVVKQLNAVPEAPELTIAQQIDNLLQDLTAVSPLAGRGLRVAGSPEGLVSFELDGASYSDIDSVPDAGARDLLRAAVKQRRMNVHSSVAPRSLLFGSSVV